MVRAQQSYFIRLESLFVSDSEASDEEFEDHYFTKSKSFTKDLRPLFGGGNGSVKERFRKENKQLTNGFIAFWYLKPNPPKIDDYSDAKLSPAVLQVTTKIDK